MKLERKELMSAKEKEKENANEGTENPGGVEEGCAHGYHNNRYLGT